MDSDESSIDAHRGELDLSHEISTNLVTGSETTTVEFLLPSEAASPSQRHGGLVAQTHMTS